MLLDVLLPKIDGFGVCELIRRQSQVPILMLTALDGEEEQLRGFGLDIDDYVTKPFSCLLYTSNPGSCSYSMSQQPIWTSQAHCNSWTLLQTCITRILPYSLRHMILR